MKVKSILVSLAALSAVFAGCSKSDEGVDSGLQTLAVTIPAEFLANDGTRGIVEDPEDGGLGSATTIANIQYFLLNGSSVVVKQYYNAAPSGTEYFEQVSGSINKVIVVANIPAADRTLVAALQNEAAIQAYAFSTASQQSTAATGFTGLNGKTLISATTNFTSATDPRPGHDATHTYKQASVTLNSVTARIEVGAVKPGTGIQSVNLVGVWINNYYTDGSKATVKFHNNADAKWDTTPLAGVSSTAYGTPTIPTYTDGSFYLAANETAVKLATDSKAYVFHTFADAVENLTDNSKDAMPHLILLVRGEYKTDYYEGTNKYFLKWVTFRRYKEAGSYITAMERTKIYKIGTGLTGIVIDAEKLTEEPETDLADFGVDVTVADWTPVNLTPEPL